MAQAIEEPFVTAVKEALGDRFTPSMEVIYRKIIKFILATLTAGLRRQTPPPPQFCPRRVTLTLHCVSRTRYKAHCFTLH